MLTLVLCNISYITSKWPHRPVNNCHTKMSSLLCIWCHKNWRLSSVKYTNGKIPILVIACDNIYRLSNPRLCTDVYLHLILDSLLVVFFNTIFLSQGKYVAGTLTANLCLISLKVEIVFVVWLNLYLENKIVVNLCYWRLLVHLCSWFIPTQYINATCSVNFLLINTTLGWLCTSSVSPDMVEQLLVLLMHL